MGALVVICALSEIPGWLENLAHIGTITAFRGQVPPMLIGLLGRLGNEAIGSQEFLGFYGFDGRTFESGCGSYRCTLGITT